MGIFYLIHRAGVINFTGGRAFSYGLVFLIGITASLSSCMAVAGGLVLSISSGYAKGKDRVWPLVMFHIARVAGFLVLGGLIGFAGTAFNLSPAFYFISSIVLFAVMLILGLNLLDIFPFLRKLQPRMPKSFSRNITGSQDSGFTGCKNRKHIVPIKLRTAFAPAALGIMTFFLPCGFTQSMQINAITSGNFMDGAVIMAVFALGTLPVLALISFTSVKFAATMKSGLFLRQQDLSSCFLQYLISSAP
jgi:uncharacterized protein